MAYHLAILKQIWLDIGTALPMGEVNLYIFNKRLWNVSKRLMINLPPLAVAPTAAKSDLQLAMAAIGHDGKDKNVDLQNVLPMTLQAFLELSKYNADLTVTGVGGVSHQILGPLRVDLIAIFNKPIVTCTTPAQNPRQHLSSLNSIVIMQFRVVRTFLFFLKVLQAVL